MQHLIPFAFLTLFIYTIVLTIAGLMVAFSHRLLPLGGARVLVMSLAAAILFIFSDNVLRAAAALMAVDEQARVRRFQSFRVFWRLMKMMPALAATQVQSIFYRGPGWVIGDSLWSVICAVERRSGREAIQRSRDLTVGLRSAGRAFAIRHFALAALAIADVIKSLGFLWRGGPIDQSNIVLTASWFPVFAVFAAAPLFLYDRTAANQTGPLLELNRTPEIRVTARAFSLSSLIWLGAGLIYFLYQPIHLWLTAGH